MITLGIIEDHKDITQLLGDFFQDDEHVSVVSSARHVDAFIRQTIGRQIDIIMLDLGLPYRNGMDCIDELKTTFPNCSIIIHSVSADHDTIFKCLCNGADSYLTKGESLAMIKETIVATHQGGSKMSVQIARKVVEYFRKKASHQSELLSLREQEVVELILKGRSYKMVADDLNISINTVRTYIKSIYKKLKVNSNIELANIYLNRR
jgi:DNA-binding NarL/FixJ family response regulator